MQEFKYCKSLQQRMQTYNDAMMSKSLQQGLKLCQGQLKVVFREYHELSSCRPLSSFMVFKTPWISSDYLTFPFIGSCSVITTPVSSHLKLWLVFKIWTAIPLLVSLLLYSSLLCRLLQSCVIIASYFSFV